MPRSPRPTRRWRCARSRTLRGTGVAASTCCRASRLGSAARSPTRSSCSSRPRRQPTWRGTSPPRSSCSSVRGRSSIPGPTRPGPGSSRAASATTAGSPAAATRRSTTTVAPSTWSPPIRRASCGPASCAGSGAPSWGSAATGSRPSCARPRSRQHAPPARRSRRVGRSTCLAWTAWGSATSRAASRRSWRPATWPASTIRARGSSSASRTSPTTSGLPIGRRRRSPRRRRGSPSPGGRVSTGATG